MWQKGTIELNGVAYLYEAKVFDNGSDFGINKGRISKLNIRVGAEWLLNYDRGWDIRPDESNADLMNVYHQILEKFA